MRQPTLSACLALAPEDAPEAPPEIWDLFCGAGGFSAGAVLAGCRIALACDSDADALETHARNHPGTTHLRASLPDAALALPTDGRHFHLHGSPPCQQFSNAGRRRPGYADQSDGLALVRWFVDTALGSRASSWSMEQVPAPAVLRLLEERRRAHPERLAYEAFYFRDLGVPQMRRGVLAGTPRLIARLRRRAGAYRWRAVRGVLTPRGDYVRNPTYHCRVRPRFRRTPHEPRGNVREPARVHDALFAVAGQAPAVARQGRFIG